jgi:hypothetical protein
MSWCFIALRVCDLTNYYGDTTTMPMQSGKSLSPVWMISTMSRLELPGNEASKHSKRTIDIKTINMET